MHFKCLRNAPCPWFERFSSHVKRCIRVCLQRFTRELKSPYQRQGAYLRHLECLNHHLPKVQSCRSQKVGFSKWCLFFILMQFWPGLCHLVDFTGERELLQQNGLQGQNQFGFIVSRTCFTFGGIRLKFFLLKWRVIFLYGSKNFSESD